MSSCSCGCSPCCCNTSGETDASECIDPGLVKTAAYAAALTEDMCGRRLAPYRGLRDDGTQDTRPSSPLKGAVMVQDDTGEVKWAAGACAHPPEKVIKVANDTDAANNDNFIDHLVGKDSNGCDYEIVGSPDAASGQWKLAWVASMRKWTTVPDTGEGSVNTDLCTTLDAAMVISPGTEEYVIEVLATGHIAAGVSIKIQGYEFVVTEVINDEYLRVEILDTISAPVTIAAGETVCNIGFRPCPRSVAPYADNMVSCLNGAAVSVELPDDVNDVAVPGFWWRDQLGRVQFVAAPVNATTGLIEPGYALRTPTTPVAGGANVPTFAIIAQKPTWLSAKVVVASKFVGSPSAPAFSIEDDVVSVSPHTGTFNMNGGSVPGYVAGKSVAVLRAAVYVDPGLGGTTCLAQVLVNGLVLIEGWVSSSGSFAFQSSVVFEAPLTDDKFDYVCVASGGALSFSKLEVIGFK